MFEYDPRILRESLKGEVDEPSRIKKLRRQIIAVLPKFPNDRQTQSVLEHMPMGSLLIHYLSWMSRFVSIRPRRVELESSATDDHRWKRLKPQIESLLDKVCLGENITPHLSLQVLSRGYTPAASQKGADMERWADKDFVLNAMGYHHFHLGTRLESGGHVERTNDVLFAKVTRDVFTAIGIFDHSVFEVTPSVLTDERTRLWQIYESHLSRNVPPGSMMILSLITTSGHPQHIVGAAGEYARVIRQLDRQLDDQAFVRRLFEDARIEIPRKPRIEWGLNFCDLGIHETRSNALFLLRTGPN